MFERATKYCKICDKCWTDSRKVGPKRPFKGHKTCPICSEPMLPTESKMHMVQKDPPGKLVFHHCKDTQLGQYHLSCWDRVISPKIKKLLDTDKKLALENYLKQRSTLDK